MVAFTIVKKIDGGMVEVAPATVKKIGGGGGHLPSQGEHGYRC
jgi:hypothetical protein